MKKNKKNIFKKKTFLLDIDTYRNHCIVVLNGDFSDIEKQIKKYNNDINLKYIEENRKDFETIKIKDGILFFTLPVGFAMVINVQSSWIETVGVVTHECLHLVHYLFRRVGISFTEESEEAYTYLQQNLIIKILKEIYL